MDAFGDPEIFANFSKQLPRYRAQSC